MLNQGLNTRRLAESEYVKRDSGGVKMLISIRQKKNSLKLNTKFGHEEMQGGERQRQRKRKGIGSGKRTRRNSN